MENWYCITPICVLCTRQILDNSDLRQLNQISDTQCSVAVNGMDTPE